MVKISTVSRKKPSPRREPHKRVLQDNQCHWKDKNKKSVFRLMVRSFGVIWIRISDLWRSFRANPFSDQWFIKSTLDRVLSDHWSARFEDGLLDHWSNPFLWAKDLKFIILPSGAQFQTGRYLIWPERLLAIASQILCMINTKYTQFCNVKSRDRPLIAGIQGSQVSIS